MFLKDNATPINPASPIHGTVAPNCGKCLTRFGLFINRSVNKERLVERSVIVASTFAHRPEGNVMFTKTLLSLSTAVVLLAGAASADTEAMAWTDLNMRSGPGPMYSILGVIPANGAVTVQGCVADASWCTVTHEGVTGWAAGNYLTANIENAPIALAAGDKRVILNTVTYDNTDASAAGGLAAGAIAGALIAGPVGAAVGAIVGTGAGAAVAPDPKVITYIQSNPVEQIYLDGEIVVGAGIPDTIMLAPVPDSEYSYAYVNGVPVLVETDKRTVTYIVR